MCRSGEDTQRNSFSWPGVRLALRLHRRTFPEAWTPFRGLKYLSIIAPHSLPGNSSPCSQGLSGDSPMAPCVQCRCARRALLITQSPERAFLSGLFTKNSCASDQLPHFCLEWTVIMKWPSFPACTACQLSLTHIGTKGPWGVSCLVSEAVFGPHSCAVTLLWLCF